MLQIGLFEARPRSDACGDVERQNLNAIVLPLSGLFSKHDAPGHHVVGTPGHAVFFAADAPYRIGFPGGIGDRAISLRFDEALAPEWLDPRSTGEAVASNALLPAGAMMLRNLLWTRLGRAAEADEFEAEALGLDLLNLSLKSVRGNARPAIRAQARPGGPTRWSASRKRSRWRRRANGTSPTSPISPTRLPFHLCHVFRELVRTSIYDYVLHERLAQTLDAVLDCGGDLTAIALDAGFTSHSHFTARFRSFFGCTRQRCGGTRAGGGDRRIAQDRDSALRH